MKQIGGKPAGMIGGKGEPQPRAKIPITKTPEHLNPDTMINLSTIESLFTTMHRMITSLTDLNAEFQLQMPDGSTFWLVPAYSKDKTRREVSFKDAATVTVICAAYGGEVVGFKFLGEGPEEGEI